MIFLFFVVARTQVAPGLNIGIIDAIKCDVTVASHETITINIIAAAGLRSHDRMTCSITKQKCAQTHSDHDSFRTDLVLEVVLRLSSLYQRYNLKLITISIRGYYNSPGRNQDFPRVGARW